jgi:hypothetical protein
LVKTNARAPPSPGKQSALASWRRASARGALVELDHIGVVGIYTWPCVSQFAPQSPHQALGGACPGDLYTPSSRVHEPPCEAEYPFHDRTVRIIRCGRICIGKRKIKLSQVFAGQILGPREVDDQVLAGLVPR